MKKSIFESIGDNLPSILSGVAVSGVLITSILSGKASIKAKAVLETNRDKPKKEKLKAVIPAYIPTIISGGITIASIVGSELLNAKNNSTLLSAYILTNNTLKAQKEAIKAIVDEDTAKEIEKKAAIERVKGTSDEFIEETGDGDTLFIEALTGRRFRSSKESVLQGEYETNRVFQLAGNSKLNFLYSQWNIRKSDIGSQLVWDEYQMNCDYDAHWIDFNHIKMNINGEECYIITYPIPPEMSTEGV